MIEAARNAVADIGAALKLSRVWIALASEDLTDSHRRTMLGPVLPLLNYLLFAGTIILILGHGKQSLNYTAYVASGVLVWLFVSETLSMSSTLFIREQGLIKGTVLPISIYVLRQTALIAIRSAYALVGAVMLVAFSGIEVTPALASTVPAFVLLLVTAPAVAVVFGVAGVFFRDLQFVIANATRLLMFITPIFWTHGGGGGLRGLLYHWNPLTHYIEIVRAPVVTGTAPLLSWAVAGSCSLLLCIAALLLLGKFNRQIVFLL